jgi:hypothetical protein
MKTPAAESSAESYLKLSVSGPGLRADIAPPVQRRGNNSLSE